MTFRHSISWLHLVAGLVILIMSHTGEALGPIGQTAAGIASLVGTLLMRTGFALS